MSEDHAGVNGVLPLTNVGIAMSMMEEALSIEAEPGLHLLYGESGWGKTTAVIAVANEFRCAYLPAMEAMSKKSMLIDLLIAIGERNHKGTIPDLARRAADRLLDTGQALIIDEADKLIKEGMLEIIRAIHDRSQVPVVLVGEELLAEKLERFERFHNRIIGFHAAQPATLADGRLLAEAYARGVEVAEDLVRETVRETRGVTRRIKANFLKIGREARAEGEASVDLHWFVTGGREFLTGAKPKRAGLQKPKRKAA